MAVHHGMTAASGCGAEEIFGKGSSSGEIRPTSKKIDAYYSWTAKEAVLLQPTDLLSQLAYFTGSTIFTRHPLIPQVLMTEGVVYLAQVTSAHWLTDAISSYLLDARAQAEPFQVWRLTVEANTAHAQLEMTDGNGSAPIIVQQIDYTDFPLPRVNLWLVFDGEHWVLMLPTEY